MRARRELKEGRRDPRITRDRGVRKPLNSNVGSGLNAPKASNTGGFHLRGRYVRNLSPVAS